MRSNKEERRIYLLRHGSIEKPDCERRYIGQLDLPLSAEGVHEACLLEAAFRGKTISAAFCSDLIRSIATAKIISRTLTGNIFIRPDLKEIGMGDWEGKTFKEIAQTYPGEYAKRGSQFADYRIPGAESFAECGARVSAAFKEITAMTQGDILIVGHAGVNRLLLTQLLGMPLENMFRLGQDYACVNILAGENGNYRVMLLNGRSIG